MRSMILSSREAFRRRIDPREKDFREGGKERRSIVYVYRDFERQSNVHRVGGFSRSAFDPREEDFRERGKRRRSIVCVYRDFGFQSSRVPDWHTRSEKPFGGAHLIHVR